MALTRLGTGCQLHLARHKGRTAALQLLLLLSPLRRLVYWMLYACSSSAELLGGLRQGWLAEALLRQVPQAHQARLWVQMMLWGHLKMKI